MHNLVHFMLAAALVIIQGATADWSKAQSEGAGDSQCIKSLDELISAFKRRETITGNHTTLLDDWHSIFDMELQYLLAYNMMFLTYQVSFPGNTTGYRCPEGASACCTPVNRGGHSPLQTHTVILYQNEIFGIFPAPLIILGTPLSVVLATSYHHNDLGVREYCWSPPAFCNGLLQIKGILRSFSIALASGKLHSVDVPTPRRARALLATKTMNIPQAVAVGFITLNITMLPAAMWFVAWCKRNLDTSSANSSTSVRQAALAAAMANSWIWYAFLYACHAVILRMAENSTIKGSHYKSGLVRGFLSPYIQNGYNMLIALAVIHLMEFVFLMCYYKGVSCQGQNRKRCKTAVSAFGTVGMVLLLQMVSGFSLYFFLLFAVKPLFAIDQLSLMCSLPALVFLLSIMGMLPCVSNSKELPKQCAVLLPLMSIFFSITALSVVLTVASFQQTSENMGVSAIISTILSSCFVGTMGYIAKRALLPHIRRDGCSEEQGHARPKEEDGEYKPLLQKV